ncbi:MAG: aldo/keto reductase [Defluviitaleaceae bacterium]|nr:aldo/keto reductase [Defluviitaleaceae bacterium]
MEYLTLNNGVKMPLLGLGTFLADGDTGQKAVITALDIGYRHIDTAAEYGNEKQVGQAIADSSVARDEIFLVTKLWNEDMRNGTFTTAFEESLNRLGVDYIDMYLLHWPAGDYVAAWQVLEKIYKSGKTRAIGVCNFQPHHIEDLRKVWSVVPVVNQIELHPELTQEPLRNFCNKLGIAVTAYSPLGGPKQAGRMMDNPLFSDIAQKYNKTAAQIVLRWGLDIGVAVIPKSANPARIAQNIDIFDFKLGKEDIAAIDALNIDRRVGYDPDNFNF